MRYTLSQQLVELVGSRLYRKTKPQGEIYEEI